MTFFFFKAKEKKMIKMKKYKRNINKLTTTFSKNGKRKI
jgi:hypothetical protein